MIAPRLFNVMSPSIFFCTSLTSASLLGAPVKTSFRYTGNRHVHTVDVFDTVLSPPSYTISAGNALLGRNTSHSRVLSRNGPLFVSGVRVDLTRSIFCLLFGSG